MLPHLKNKITQLIKLLNKKLWYLSRVFTETRKVSCEKRQSLVMSMQ
jgi:hypothetical protein